jgi:hypothetical protein
MTGLEQAISNVTAGIPERSCDRDFHDVKYGDISLISVNSEIKYDDHSCQGTALFCNSFVKSPGLGTDVVFGVNRPVHGVWERS